MKIYKAQHHGFYLYLNSRWWWVDRADPTALYGMTYNDDELQSKVIEEIAQPSTPLEFLIIMGSTPNQFKFIAVTKYYSEAPC